MSDLLHCPDCGKMFDPSDLAAVAVHQHAGLAIDNFMGIKGTRVKPTRQKWYQTVEHWEGYASQLESYLEHIEATRQAAPVEARGEGERLREAARVFIEKLDAVHDDPRFGSVWQISQLHVGPYTGPTYADEFAALKAALKPAPVPQGAGTCKHGCKDGWIPQGDLVAVPDASFPGTTLHTHKPCPEHGQGAGTVCPECGKVFDELATGEYPCMICGMPGVHDDSCQCKTCHPIHGHGAKQDEGEL